MMSSISAAAGGGVIHESHRFLWINGTRSCATLHKRDAPCRRSTDHARRLCQCAELAKAFVIFSGAMSQGLTLRRRLLELVRLRICLSQPMPQLHGRSL